MKRAALIVFLLGAAAGADEIDDRLRVARVLLESDLPEERDKGVEELAKVAADAGKRLQALIEHPDAEVRGRVAELLGRMQIIPEEGKTARLREMFGALKTQDGSAAERREAVRNLLALDARVAEFVAWELANPTFEWKPDFPAVAAPGRITVPFEIVNKGTCGAWVMPGRWYVLPHHKRFGERPGRLTMHAGAAGGQVGLRRRGESDEDVVVGALASMVRIPAGESFVLRTSSSEQPRVGILSLSCQAMGTSPAKFEATFGRTAIAVPETLPAGHPTATRYVLGECQGTRVRLAAWRDEEETGVEMTALEDLPAMSVKNSDPFWWVALDEEGVFLDSGAFETTEEDLAALPKGSSRRLVRHGALPAGTRTLWMGCTLEDEDCVPAPVEIR
ncbi:MAG: hypothetical protein IT452_22630 [Planctomycetia bacterium]|nr:hypothetical protein [Planctomycetia bacterium]